MQALSQSIFLQALGYAIANSLWQSALLWLAVVIINNVFKFSSRIKYSVALVAQATGFAWFISTLYFYYQACSDALASVNIQSLNANTEVIIDPASHSFPALLLSAVVKGEQLLPFLSIAYLVLLLFLSVKWIKSYGFTQHIKKSGLRKPDVQWKLFVKRVAEQLSIKPEVKIYLSGLIKSPLTIGFIKPMILIPIAGINHLTAEQMEAVILHELAHIKRADYLINIIISVVEMTLFFNPFTQLLSKLIKKERENSCDDWVLQFQYNASMYAEALLRIAYFQTSSTLAMQAAGAKGDLLSRVKRMLDQKEKTFNYRNQLLALLLMTGIISSVAWFHPQAKTQPYQNTFYKTQQVVVEPLTAKVNNPFFNPVFFLSKPLHDEINKTLQDAQLQMQSSKEQVVNKTNDMIARITPGVMEKINELQFDIQDEIQNAGNETDNELKNIDLPALVTDSKKLIDTALIAASLRDVFQKGIARIDVDKINAELVKTASGLDKMSKDNKWLAPLAGKWNSIIQKSVDEIRKVKIDPPRVPDIFFKHQLHSSNSKNEAAEQDALKKQADKIQQEVETKQKQLDSLQGIFSYNQNWLQDNAGNKTLSGPASDFYGQQIFNTNAVSVNLPVKFNAANYSYSVSAEKNKPVIVVLKGDPKNAESTIKKITIATFDSTGEKHIYNITVETYQ